MSRIDRNIGVINDRQSHYRMFKMFKRQQCRDLCLFRYHYSKCRDGTTRVMQRALNGESVRTRTSHPVTYAKSGPLGEARNGVEEFRS